MELAYGSEKARLDLQAGKPVTLIRADAPTPSASPEDLVTAALDSCAPQLHHFHPGEKVVIVVSDITRYSGSEIFLPLLVARLNAVGIVDADITVVIALGIHRPQTETEHRKLLGPLYGRIAVADHECDNPEELVFLGETSGGIPVEINRTVAEADRLILTGTIGFHYFAGFGGGRKSILPGVASRRSCMASHFAVLNPSPGRGRNRKATTGILEGNPVHEAMLEACEMVAPDFILNTVLTPDKKLLAVFAGDWRKAHLEGCRFYGEKFSRRLAEPADLVVVSCGGFPKDINFIQAHKSMEYGCQALKRGGVMILLAQCQDGYGNATFFNWFRFKELDPFEMELRRHYEINGQTAYATLQKAQKFRVILVSELNPDEVSAMGMIPATTLAGAVARAESLLPTDYTVYVIPEGGAVLPVVAVND